MACPLVNTTGYICHEEPDHLNISITDNFGSVSTPSILVDVIIKIADKAVPKTQAVKPNKYVPWWNPELASLVAKRNKHKLKKENRKSTDILKEYKEMKYNISKKSTWI